MTFGERLTQLRKEHGYATRNEFAEKLGIPSTTLRNYETDAREPGHTFLRQISEMFNVSIDYLLCLTNEKEILNTFRLRAPEQKMVEKYRKLDAHGEEIVNFILDKEYNRSVEAQTHPATIIEFQPTPDDHGHLAEYFRSASAGSGVFILGNEATAKILVSESDWDARADFVISVAGDSMLPDYCDGDKVLVSQRTEMRHGDVGIFVVNGNVYIKEYGTDELISRNPDSPNIKIAEYDNIVCMGKVIGKIKGPFQIIED